MRGGGGYHLCVGSLISPTSVLSTATCCMGGITVARGGDYLSDSTDQYEEDIPVRQVVAHQDFDDWTLANDICLIRLDRPADTSSKYVSTITLPTDSTDILPGQTCQEITVILCLSL